MEVAEELGVSDRKLLMLGAPDGLLSFRMAQGSPNIPALPNQSSLKDYQCKMNNTARCTNDWEKHIGITGLHLNGSWHNFSVQPLSVGSSAGVMTAPPQYYDLIYSHIKNKTGCTSFGDQTLCNCTMNDLPSAYPTLKFKIGDIEYNNTIQIEPKYFVQKFTAVQRYSVAEISSDDAEEQQLCHVLINKGSAWSLGTVLYQQYQHSLDNRNKLVGLAGPDMVCNNYMQVFFFDQNQNQTNIVVVLPNGTVLNQSDSAIT